MESAMLKPRSESPRNTSLRVHFKHPLEEDACSIEKLRRNDPLIQMHAKEIIAAKLIEGYAIKDEKCPCCHMPLMCKDNAWDGMFCGQEWYQNQKTGECVVCTENDDEEEESHASSLDEPKKEFDHSIPAFPEEYDHFDLDDAEDISFSRDSHDGSVGEFKKKFAIHSDVHIKKIEMNTEVDEMCAKELNNASALSPEKSRNCPSCGMEMLNFGEDLECPFCALEIIKEELGIAGMDVGAEGNITPRSKSDSGVVEGMYLRDLVAASSSCSTLSGSLRLVEADEENREDAAKQGEKASISETHSETGTMIVINAVLDHVKDAQKQRALNSAPEESLAVKEECKSSLLPQDDTEDIEDVSEAPPDDAPPEDAPPEDAPQEADSTHMAVNAVLKRLITGFWMENNEKTPEIKEETPASLGADKMVEEKSDNVEVEEAQAENPVNDEGSVASKEFIHSVKSINDDLQDKVKSFASFVFGTREEKADMFKSNEIKVQRVDDNHDEEGDSFRNSDREHQKTSQEGDSNSSDRDEHQLNTVESKLFDEDMSADEIFATLNEIEAVTKNILDLPVFNANDKFSPDLEEETLSREDEETSYRENDETSFREEGDVECSTVDPPSVCSRNSRRDPPNLNANSCTYEPLDENLLLLRKDNAMTPDTRDPPSTTTHKHLSMLEFSFSETLPPTGADRFPRDPSEHGGSLELDSFSHDDEQGDASTTHSEAASKAVIKSSDNELVDQGLSSENGDVASSSRPGKQDQCHAIVGKETTADGSEQNMTSIATCDPPLHNNMTNTHRQPAEPMGTSFPITSKSYMLGSGISYQKTHAPRHLREPEENSNMKCQKREPIEPESRSGSPTLKVEGTLKQVKDLYQRPDFLTKMMNEPESSRDAMVRQRLIQLNSRYQKLTSQSKTESHHSAEMPVESTHQKLSSVCSDASQSLLSTSVELSKSNAQHIFREQQFTFDNLDTTTVSTLPLSIKGTDSGLSPSAAARHEHYKKQLFDIGKNGLRSHGSNDTGTCLSPSAAQRRQHYKEVLREQMAKQRQQIVSQE